MISLPRWMVAGPAWALAVYDLAFAVVGVRWGSYAASDLTALALFAVAFALPVALRGRFPLWAELVVVALTVALPPLVTMGLDPADGSYSIGGWYVSGVACLAIVLLVQHRVRSTAVVLAWLVLHTVLWAGLPGLVGYGVIAVVLLVAVGAVAAWAVNRADDDMRRFSAAEREAAEWRAAQDAFHFERQVRLVRTGRAGSAMLHRIIDADGRLTEEERQECRVLEQTIRDEIRGRRLLNAGVRAEVLAARRRGAFVQVLDDGGLDEVPDAQLDPLLDRVAAALAPLASTRIVIRTSPKDADTAITVVATTVDPTAAALGLDDDEEVDLWLEVARPAAVPA